MNRIFRSATIAVSFFAWPAIAFAQDAASNALPWCSADGITRPVMQTQMSLQDSYPPMSVALGEEGPTVVNFTVNRNGTVSDVSIASSSGFARLDEASVSAMKQMLYSQPKKGEVPVDCRSHLKIVWKFNETPDDPRPMPLVLTPPASWYPAAARAGHREGVAYIVIVIGGDGKMESMKVLQSSGSSDLDEASQAYIKALRIQPMQIDGRSARSVTAVNVIWSLDPKASAAGH